MFQEEERFFAKDENDRYNGDNLDKIYLDEAAQELRAGFVRKVFSILSLQLFVTFGSILFFSFNHDAKNYLASPEKSSGLFAIANLGLIGSTIAIICCNHLTRKHPHNMILLAVYTFSQSVLLSSVALAFDVATISLAVGATLTVTALLAVFAQTTTIDFTQNGIYLYVALWVLILFGFVTMIISVPFMNVLYTYFGTLLFCCYIIYDVQLIIGGGHKLQFSIDDYVMAALMLYIDIIQLFIFILRLLGQSNNS